MFDPLHNRAATHGLRLGLLAGLLAMNATVKANVPHAPPLPYGWTAQSQPLVTGSFHQPGKRDVVVLTDYGKKGQGEYYGVLLFPDMGSGKPGKVVKTFIATGSTAPRLALVKPGSYAPACHGGKQCTPVNISNQAIGLCFDAVRCEIIYFSGSDFRELVVTD